VTGEREEESLVVMFCGGLELKVLPEDVAFVELEPAESVGSVLLMALVLLDVRLLDAMGMTDDELIPVERESELVSLLSEDVTIGAAPEMEPLLVVVFDVLRPEELVIGLVSV